MAKPCAPRNDIYAARSVIGRLTMPRGVVVAPLRFAADLNRRALPRERTEDQLPLQPRQHRADAGMDPVTESNMVRIPPRDVVPVRVLPRRGSRFAAPRNISTLRPSPTCSPPISTSRAVVRKNVCTRLSSRTASSNAARASDGSARNLANCPGKRARQYRAAPIPFTVVYTCGQQ